MISSSILATLGARLADPDAPRVQCKRWACELTARACGTRYVAGLDRFAPTTYALCRGCDVGAGNAALVTPRRKRDAHSAQRDALSAPPPPREIVPFYERRGGR